MVSMRRRTYRRQAGRQAYPASHVHARAMRPVPGGPCRQNYSWGKVARHSPRHPAAYIPHRTWAVNQPGNRMFKQIFATKPVKPAGHVDAGEPFEGSLEGEPTLQRTLTGTQLIMLGVGAVIGAGIFVLTGQAAAEYAG